MKLYLYKVLENADNSLMTESRSMGEGGRERQKEGITKGQEETWW